MYYILFLYILYIFNYIMGVLFFWDYIRINVLLLPFIPHAIISQGKHFLFWETKWRKG